MPLTAPAHAMTPRLAVAILLCAVLAASAARAVSPAETAASILARNLQARGVDRWKTFDTMRLRGAVTSRGKTVPVLVLRKRPNRLRQETAFDGGTVIAAFDGRTAWAINPFRGTDAPRRLTGAEAEDAAAQADFDGPLVDPAAHGFTVALAGAEAVDGRQAYRLTLTKPDAPGHDFLIDAATWLEIRSVTTTRQDGRPVTLDTDFDDYRSVDGVMVPFRVRTSMDGQAVSVMQVERVELGVRIPDAVFGMPKGAENRIGQCAMEGSLRCGRPWQRVQWLSPLSKSECVERLTSGVGRNQSVSWGPLTSLVVTVLGNSFTVSAAMSSRRAWSRPTCMAFSWRQGEGHSLSHALARISLYCRPHCLCSCWGACSLRP